MTNKHWWIVLGILTVIVLWFAWPEQDISPADCTFLYEMGDLSEAGLADCWRVSMED